VWQHSSTGTSTSNQSSYPASSQVQVQQQAAWCLWLANQLTWCKLSRLAAWPDLATLVTGLCA
jgi:hypothetical protein